MTTDTRNVSDRNEDIGTAFAVTAIVPAYNAEPFLEDCLRSILAQTYPVEEIIVVDDGSTDRTQAIAASFGSRVRLLQQHRGGPARARNLATAQATTRYVAFIDADDMWQPEKIAEQVAAMQRHPEAVLCYTGILALKLNGSFVSVDPPTEHYVDATLRLTNPGIPPSTVLVQRETVLRLGGFSEIQKGCEDWDFLYRMRELGSFCCVNNPSTIYRESLGGLSSNAQHMYNDFLLMLDRLLVDDMTGVRRWIWRRRILSYQQYKAALTARHAKQPALERNFALRSLLTWPSPFWHPRRFATTLVTFRNTLRA